MYGALLPHLVRVRRRSDASTDRFGQPTERRYEVGAIRGRLTSAVGGETFTERSRDVVKATHTLFLERGADVREDDVLDVEDASTGSTLLLGADVLLVRKVYGRGAEHHREAKLHVISGAE